MTTLNTDSIDIAFKPVMLDPLVELNFTADVKNQTNYFNISVPERYDANGDSVSLEIISQNYGNISCSKGENSTRYMVFDNVTDTLQLILGFEDLRYFNGTNQITFHLTDSSVQRLSSKYSFLVNLVIPYTYYDSFGDFGLVAEEVLTSNLTAEIIEANMFGNASIEFSQPMLTRHLNLT